MRRIFIAFALSFVMAENECLYKECETFTLLFEHAHQMLVLKTNAFTKNAIPSQRMEIYPLLNAPHRNLQGELFS